MLGVRVTEGVRATLFAERPMLFRGATEVREVSIEEPPGPQGQAQRLLQEARLSTEGPLTFVHDLSDPVRAQQDQHLVEGATLVT